MSLIKDRNAWSGETLLIENNDVASLWTDWIELEIDSIALAYALVALLVREAS